MSMGKGKLAVIFALSIVWGLLTYGLDWFFKDKDMVGTTFGTTYTQIGLVLAITAFVNAVAMLGSGRVADMFGRKRTVVLSYIGLAICYFAYIFAIGSAALPVLYIVGTIRMIFAATSWVATLAWVADFTTVKNRGTILSAFTMALTVANIAALAFIGIAYQNFGSFMSFVIVAVIQGVAVVPLLFIAEAGDTRIDSKARKPTRSESRRTWREVVRDTPLMILSFAALFATSAGILIQFIMVPLLQLQYGFSLAETFIPLVFMMLFTMIGYVVAAYLIDKKRIKRGLLIGSLVATEIPLLFLFLAGYLPFMQSLIAIIVFFGLFGLTLGASTPTFLTLVTDLAPTGETGTELGVYQGIMNFAYVPGNLLGGYLWDIGSLQTAMLGCMLLEIVALILVVGTLRKSLLAARGVK